MRGNCNIEAAGIGTRVRQHRGAVVIQSDSAETGRRPRKKEDVEKTLLKRKEGAVPFIATSCEDRVGIVGAEKRTHSGSWETPEPPSLPSPTQLATSEA